MKLLLGHSARRHRACRLEHVRQRNFFAAGVAVQHRAARYRNRRDIHPKRAHKHAGHYLVAVGHKHHRVERVSTGQALHRVGNKLARDKRVLHALVSHRYAVANADGRHDHRVAAGGDYALLDRTRYFRKVRVPRDNLALSADHAHKRLADFVVRPPERLHQRAMRRFVRSCLDFIAVHACFSVFICLFFAS